LHEPNPQPQYESALLQHTVPFVTNDGPQLLTRCTFEIVPGLEAVLFHLV
jgi:hypothetical protein